LLITLLAILLLATLATLNLHPQPGKVLPLLVDLDSPHLQLLQLVLLELNLPLLFFRRWGLLGKHLHLPKLLQKKLHSLFHFEQVPLQLLLLVLDLSWGWHLSWLRLLGWRWR